MASDATAEANTMDEIRADFSEKALAIIEEVQERAIKRAGADDFGPSDYLRPLAMIVEDAKDKPGLDFWKEELEIALVGRLVREASWKAHPGYKARAVPAPLVICGIPRTGTTALHKLLSIDPQFQGLDHWLTAWPKPRPPRGTWANEPGFQHAVGILEKRFANQPGMKISHDVVADEVDECLEILRLDFVANRFPSMTSLPNYDAWYQQQDETPFYRRFADTVRLIGLNDDRQWLLKNPGHYGHLDALLAIFPDARIIITHRDPVKSIPSLCSVLQHSHTAMDPNADLADMGRREMAYWSDLKRRTQQQRATIPDSQIMDVHHRDFHADPIGVARSIYDHFGLNLTPEVEADMRTWLAANPADKHGVHTYALATYGLSASAIQETFGVE